MRVKILTPYCEGVSKSLKPEKLQTLPIPFSPLESALVNSQVVSTIHGGHLTVEDDPKERSQKKRKECRHQGLDCKYVKSISAREC